MPIDYDRLMAYAPPSIEHSFSERDSIIYALGVGLGCESLDPQQLRFVYEKQLLALPTMACILGYMRISDLDLGINYSKVLHGDQATTLHHPLPVQGTVVSTMKVRDIVDRGEKGAIIYLDRTVVDKASGTLLANVQMGVFCRADGGFGGPNTTSPPVHEIPTRPPDASCVLPTSQQTALIYRLSGDANPLHVDPEAARRAGFERPILHGLATYGVVGHAILKLACDYDPAILRSLSGRFSAPVYPGEAITTEIWRDGTTISFRASVAERGVVVMNNGRAVVGA